MGWCGIFGFSRNRVLQSAKMIYTKWNSLLISARNNWERKYKSHHYTSIRLQYIIKKIICIISNLQKSGKKVRVDNFGNGLSIIDNKIKALNRRFDTYHPLEILVDNMSINLYKDYFRALNYKLGLGISDHLVEGFRGYYYNELAEYVNFEHPHVLINHIGYYLHRKSCNSSIGILKQISLPSYWKELIDKEWSEHFKH